MSRSLKPQNQHGFTIIELMIATLVFSVVLMAATSSLLQIGKLYYKGVISGRAQETTRGIVDQISQQLQFSGASVTPGTDNLPSVTGAPGGKLTFHAFCVGTTRYSYIVNAQVSQAGAVAPGSYDPAQNRLLHALWRDTVSGGSCTAVDLSQTKPTANGTEMLQENMRLTSLQVPVCDTSNICQLSVGIIYGDNDLLTPAPSPDPTVSIPTHCETIIGSQWCAASQLTTSVLKRIGN